MLVLSSLVFGTHSYYAGGSGCNDNSHTSVHRPALVPAFEAQGIEFDLALSTSEALHKLSNNKYAAIISDMERKEGSQEGYVLLDKLRSDGNSTPFIVYASSNLPEHKRMAREKGAVGSTNRAEELFQLVMAAVSNGS